MNKKVITAAALVVFTVAAYSQESALGSLFGAIKKLATAPQESSAMQAAPDTSSEADEIVRQLGSSGGYGSGWSACSQSGQTTIQNEINSAGNKFRMGQFGMAAAESYHAALTIAYCTTKDGGVASAAEKNTIGKMLALSAIGNQEAGLNPSRNPQSDTAIRAKYALTLLKLTPEVNKELIYKVENSGIFPEKAPVASSVAEAKMSTFDAVTKFQKNQVAFDNLYYGKTIQLTGNILTISGDSKRAVVYLEGIIKNADERRWQDSAQCKITDPSAMSDLMKVGKGDKVTVRGLLKREPLVDYGVTLADCRFTS